MVNGSDGQFTPIRGLRAGSKAEFTEDRRARNRIVGATPRCGRLGPKHKTLERRCRREFALRAAAVPRRKTWTIIVGASLCCGRAREHVGTLDAHAGLSTWSIRAQSCMAMSSIFSRGTTHETSTLGRGRGAG